MGQYINWDGVSNVSQFLDEKGELCFAFDNGKNHLYEYIIQKCREQISNVQTGIFGADMQISLTNDGPFTIILDSVDLA